MKCGKQFRNVNAGLCPGAFESYQHTSDSLVFAAAPGDMSRLPRVGAESRGGRRGGYQGTRLQMVVVSLCSKATQAQRPFLYSFLGAVKTRVTGRCAEDCGWLKTCLL